MVVNVINVVNGLNVVNVVNVRIFIIGHIQTIDHIIHIDHIHYRAQSNFICRLFWSGGGVFFFCGMTVRGTDVLPLFDSRNFAAFDLRSGFLAPTQQNQNNPQTKTF